MSLISFLYNFLIYETYNCWIFIRQVGNEILHSVILSPYKSLPLKRTPSHISVIFDSKMYRKIENLNEILELLVDLGSLVSIYDQDGLTRQTSVQGLESVLCDGLMYLSKDRQRLPKGNDVGKIDARTLTLMKLLRKDSKSTVDLGEKLYLDNTPPPPDMIFVIGGFLLEFSSYPPLMLKNAEFCHIR